MNEIELKQRLNELVAQREKQMALVNVIDGAMQDCEYWLMRLSQESQEVDDEPLEKGKKEQSDGEANSEETEENSDQ